MLETHLRSTVQPLLNSIAQKLTPFCSPNSITVVAFITGLSAGVSIALHHFMVAGIFLGISGLCDMLDGTMARVTNTSTTIGAYCDLIADRMVEAAVILGFAFAMPEYALAYITFFIAVLLHFSTFLAAGALFPNAGKKSMHYDNSLVERAEAFLVFFIMLVVPEYAYQSLLCFNGLVLCSGISRFVRVIKSQH